MKKAQALLYVILIITIFLVIILGYVALILREHLIQRSLSDSVAAYYIAETGIEYAGLYIRTNNTTGGFPNDDIPLVRECTNIISTPESNFEVSCTGKRNNVRRTLKVTFPKDTSSGNVVFPVYWKEIEIHAL